MGDRFTVCRGAGELVRVLADRGVDAALSTLLLTLHTLQVLPRGEGASGGAQEWGLELLDKGVEFSQGLPGVGALLKFGRWMYNRAQRQEAEFTARDLGLWPVESGGRVDLQAKDWLGGIRRPPRPFWRNTQNVTSESC